MDYVCEECGTLGWENELKNWHQRKTGCDGRIVKVGTIQKDPPEREVNLPEFDKEPDLVCQPVRHTPVETPDGDGESGGHNPVPAIPKQRWSRESYNAYMKGYMQRRRAK